MNLKTWLKEERLKAHSTSREEIEKLFNIVNRDLSDADISGLSPDRKFSTAYNAALQLATIVLRTAGFRTNSNKTGHHRISIDALDEIMGKELEELSNYLNACRVKRHICDYTSSGEVSEAEASEIIKEIKDFKTFVINWIKKTHPHFLPAEHDH
ncbi:MAG: hypothetical protein KBA81_08185 [Rhabdochlamydiaceae bacterium]|nr:hypothetical protein [Rhabdochlamydiaceae bacterium]